MLKTAFVLGAGLGTRLRPLTNTVPKPMVPVWGKPLITFAFDHLIAELNIERFIVNTHHCPKAYAEAFPEQHYRDRELVFRHEPTLLDTGGGIANIRDLVAEDESLIIYNGDILADFSLTHLCAAHHAGGEEETTLAVRTSGPSLQVGMDISDGKVHDIRGIISKEKQSSTDCLTNTQFTGVYIMGPAALSTLPPADEPYSIVREWLAGIRAGQNPCACIIDDGEWRDLGTLAALKDAHELLRQSEFPKYGAAFVAEHPQIRESELPTLLDGCGR